MQHYYHLSSLNRSLQANGGLKNKRQKRCTTSKMVTLEPISERHQMNDFPKRPAPSSTNNDAPSTSKVSSGTTRAGGGGSESLIAQHGNNADKMKNPDNRREKSARRPYDMVIFAASSSVGQFLVEELALIVDKSYSSCPTHSKTDEPPNRRQSVPSSKRDDIRWAIAGRSAIQLNETLCRAELSAGIRDLAQNVSIILADLNRHDSLVNMCQQTELVINCAGPYLEYGGELLINASIESKTNYLDLSHEINFNEFIRQKYSDQAKEAGVFILQGCGFQSMSSELGLNFTKQVADGQIDQVKIILNLNDTKAAQRDKTKRSNYGIITPAMWHSLLADKEQANLRWRGDHSMDMIGDSGTHQSLRVRRKEQLSDGEAKTTQSRQQKHHHQLERKDTQTLVRDIIQFRNRDTLSFWWPPIRFVQNSIIRLFSLVTFGRSSRSLAQEGDSLAAANKAGYSWPIDCLTSDESQLIRSEMSNYELRRPDLAEHSGGGWRPIQCSNFYTFKSFAELCSFCLWLFLFQMLMKFSITRRLMRHFSGLSSMNYVAPSRATSKSMRGDGSDQRPLLDRSTLSHIKFSQTFLAYGTPSDDSGDPLESRDKESKRRREQLLVSRIVGPEPNHVATATYAIQAALTLLLERDHLPRSPTGQLGGVLTPGAAFAETNIIYQLRKRNIKFEVLKKA